MPKHSFQASHLELRYKTYYAVLYVPRGVRHLVGKTKFSRSTGTSNLLIAERRANALVLAWKAEIERAQFTAPDPIIAEAVDLLMHSKRKDLLPGTVDEIIEQRALEIDGGDDAFAAEEFKLISTGRSAALEVAFPLWKKYLVNKGLKQKTIDQMCRDVELLKVDFRAASRLNERNVKIWINNVAETLSLTPSSVVRTVGSCKSFYVYMQEVGDIPKEAKNPFVVPQEFQRTKKRNAPESNRVDSWLHFEEEDVIRLYAEAFDKEDKELADLIYFGAYTGFRIEEICSLKKCDVSLKKLSLSVTDAKTEAGYREVPIHSKLLSLATRLKNAGRGEYLFENLTPNKYGDRSNAIGKRFGRMKSRLGYGDRHVFHSIRKAVITKLENAGVSENVTADIVGHEKPRITYGLYSGGTSLEVKRVALEHVSFAFP